MNISLILLLLTPAQLPDSLPIPPSVSDSLDLSGHTVVLSIDDGYHSVFSEVYPLLKQYDFPITLAVITDYLAGGAPSYGRSNRFMNRAEIQEMLDSCAIEVASHSRSHAFLTKLDSTRAWSEIAGSKVILESLFGQDVYTFVYPYGDVDARVRRLTRLAGYKLGRSVRPGEANFWTEPYRLPTYELRREVRLTDVQQRISNRRMTILLLHQIVDTPVAFTQWSKSDFTRLLDWLHRTNVRVTTLSGLYREWWLKRLAQYMDEVAQAFPDRRKRLLFEDVNIDVTGTSHSR